MKRNEKFAIDRAKSGIYIICNIVDNKIYLGSAVSIRKRWNTHLYDLLKNRHHSILLQRAWNKYGEDSFKFEVIEYIDDKTKLIEREQYWLNLLKPYDPSIGYNVERIAGSQLGFKHSEETKKLMSLKRIGKTVGHKGVVHTEEFKEKQRQRLSGNTWNIGRSHPNPFKGITDISKNCLNCDIEFSGPRFITNRKKFCSRKCCRKFWTGKKYNV